MGQHLERHILKGAGGAMPQLQHLGSLGEMIHRGHVSRIKLLPQPICLIRIVRQLFLGEVV